MTVRRRRIGRDGERGSATVCLAAFAVLPLLVGVAGVVKGAAVLTRHQVESAADLAALAAATRLAGGLSDGCQVAGRIVAANGAELVQCRLMGWWAEVTAQKTLAAGRLGSYRVVAGARAGPAGQERADSVTGASGTSEPSLVR
jgi:secretion/DNA translocation related TadE-like protein